MLVARQHPGVRQGAHPVSRGLQAQALPAFLYNIGQCHRHLKQCERAIFFFKQFLDRKPDTPYRTRVDELIGDCERKLAEERAAARPASAPASQVAVPQRPPVEPPPRRDARWLWGGGALTATLAIVGAACGGVALSQNHEYTDATTSIERRRELKDSGERLQVASSVMLGLAGGAAVATVLVYWLVPRKARASAERTAIWPGAGTLTVSGSF